MKNYLKKIFYALIGIGAVLLLGAFVVICKFCFSDCLFEYNLMDILGVFATVAAAIASFKLGKIANEQNNRLMKIEEEREKRRISCVILLQNVENVGNAKEIILSDDKIKYEFEKYIYFNVTNASDAILRKIVFDFGEEKFESHLVVHKDFPKNIKVPLPIGFDGKVRVTFISCYDKKTYATFRIKDKIKELPEKELAGIKYYHFNADKENLE